jgi:hypothetical protein
MTSARRAAFDEALRARLQNGLERPRRRKVWVPAFATAAVVAAITFLVLSGRFRSVTVEGERESGAIVAEASSAAQWEYDLVYLDELAPSEDREESELLPDDCLAIASVFLSG